MPMINLQYLQADNISGGRQRRRRAHLSARDERTVDKHHQYNVILCGCLMFGQ